ncbi:deferrochelatase/peroxidase EfeB [Agrococcus jejuensis]|uniref:Deferrochelatase n=2 Tax=Agrococcus jejuensis TaxID=399736 RepID=A0A1G8CDM0_9MICO|nr:deferrochelatase/peroxidase EfeB [Agrococcus jejuensis]
MLGLIGAGGAGLALGGVGGAFAGAQTVRGERAARAYDFHGEHQQGVTTLSPDALVLASLDMVDGATVDDLRELLADWTYAASRLAQGLEVAEDGAIGASPEAPPPDSGEALGLDAAGLTLTFGVGPTLFDDRFDLAERRPAALVDLPLFAGDLLEPARCGGDLVIQACAADSQVALHAVRNLLRIGFGRAQVRWLQTGFTHAEGSAERTMTPRNLLGFKDGSANLRVDDAAHLGEFVWVGDDADQPWMAGGTYLVARRIRMTVESWDRTRLREQERVIGRTKVEGAPLSGGEERDDVDLDATDDTGQPAMDADAHVRLAHPSVTGTRILRRPFNYVDGVTSVGQLDAGLVFLSFQRDPEQFVTIQRSLRTDLLNEYIRHVGSAVFAILPGVAEGESLGDRLLG